MPTLFTRIIDGELPGRFVWRDDRCAAFLSIAPMGPAHTLVVPIQEVDRWTDLEVELAEHLMGVAHTIARAQQDEFTPTRVGLIIAGMEVPHCHLHCIPINRESDLHFENANGSVSPEELDANADRLRAALERLA
jgi:diadenosine tetraphosphate (Ap4A) HIT family hydrolase